MQNASDWARSGCHRTRWCVPSRELARVGMWRAKGRRPGKGDGKASRSMQLLCTYTITAPGPRRPGGLRDHLRAGQINSARSPRCSLAALLCRMNKACIPYHHGSRPPTVMRSHSRVAPSAVGGWFDPKEDLAYDVGAEKTGRQMRQVVKHVAEGGQTHTKPNRNLPE